MSRKNGRVALPPYVRAMKRIVVNGECWEFTGPKAKGGYGLISDSTGAGKKTVLVHRSVFVSLKGPIPEGCIVMHTCDNRACINPDHLVAGTQLENVRDCAAKGRRRYSGRKGEENHKAKLTESAVLDIRASLKNGVTQNALAAKYAVTQELISRVKLRKAWKHI